ncbi:hypothetical protein AAOGI_15720 [Agarivorans albus]
MKKLFAIYLHSMMRLAEHSRSMRWLLRKGNTALVKHLVKQYQKNGLSAWQAFWIPAFSEYGKYRAPYLVKKMNIDQHSARAIGSYHDYEDPIFGVEGHWEIDANGDPVRVETACVACEDLMRESQDPKCSGEFCRHIVSAMENATGCAINPNYKVEIIALLTEGDESCRFVHHVN